MSFDTRLSRLIRKVGFAVVEIFPWKKTKTIVIGRDKFSSDGNFCPRKYFNNCKSTLIRNNQDKNNNEKDKKLCRRYTDSFLPQLKLNQQQEVGNISFNNCYCLDCSYKCS